MSGNYPRIRIQGDVETRSRQYGTLARQQIHEVREGYERAYAANGVTWADATEQALKYVPALEREMPDLLNEIRGIAEGSELPFEDILAINCRTEILYAVSTANARKIAPWFGRGECSAFAVESDRSADGVSLVGQNWDWLETLQGGTIILEVERDDGPNYVTIVEAGLLAKMVMNEHGLAYGITTLATNRDGGTEGIPYHFMIRRLADSHHIAGALGLLASTPRASSGNVILAGADGAILNLETAPGDVRSISAQSSTAGVLVHTNHFLDPVTAGYDLAPLVMSDSFVRFGRMTRNLAQRTEPITADHLKSALSDHAEAPNSVCCHPEAGADPHSRWKTLFSVIMNPSARTLTYAEGPPCENVWIEADFTDLLRT